MQDGQSTFSNQLRETRRSFERGWSLVRHQGPGQVRFWFIALAVGIAAGLVTLGFRFCIAELQQAVYGNEDVKLLHSFAETLPWWFLLLTPCVGGLAVGIILHFFTKDGRVRSVADVIEGAALRDGRVEKREGIASAFASLITLSTGGSTGREGPVVHLSGVVATWVSDRIKADGITGRDLLGCAVAAAVSASFNAPIAGALFALEVVLRHFAVHAFAPIVIASVAGTVISRVGFGDVTEFRLAEEGALQFYVELPAFLLLGLVCGLVAVLFMRGLFFADDVANNLQARTGLPGWARPAVAGLLVGALAIWFPHVIGVGYETTARALTADLGFTAAFVYCVVKAAAVAITVAGRMGGGVFSPSLMIGALTGLSFGLVATQLFPEVSGTVGLYALAGMGGVAAAVLGAPISTTLIVFELTGDWQTGLAVMVAVSMSTALASRMVDRSYFLTQLERRNIHVAAGPQAYLLSLHSAAVIMRAMDSPRAASASQCEALIAQGLFLQPDATLETAMPMFDKSGEAFIPVLAPPAPGGQEGQLMGAVFHVDALRAYNRSLAATAAEEHS